MKKRIFSVLFMAFMVMSMMSNTALATFTEPVDSPAYEVLEAKPAYGGLDIGLDVSRGSKKPTKFYNLNGADYDVDGTFDVSTFTAYYFNPNADGKLYYNLVVDWEESYAVQKGAGVECWDKTTNKLKTTASFKMKVNSDGLYGPTVETGNRVISNLDPTHDYYLRIYKSTDSVVAHVTGTIWA